jgi:outer membrane protein assembly factor BamA
VPGSMPLNDRRYELAGFPIVGGNSDIGVQFGGAATLTRFYDGAFPYLWNIDLLLSASVKDDQNGFNLVQQSHVLRLDALDLWSGRLRLDTRASYQRTINMGYYGLGNAATADLTPLPGQTTIGKRYEYLQDEGRVRTIARFHTKSRLDLVLGGLLRYEAPVVYPGSQLATDLAARNPDGSPVAIGGQTSLLAGLAAGIMIDTRDSEFVTREGFFYQVGAGATVGSAEQVAYGNASAVLEHFAPLGGPFVFASRVVASFEFGRVPFYDLAQGGTFEPQYLLGGETGVRGVPIGRYAGPVKMIANTEIRATPFPRFTLWGQRLRIGTTAFFDAGRVWDQYRITSQVDGTSLWLKYGIGGGVFLQWGEAAIFRVEVAYSPDAESENPGLPLGIYVADGLMF